MACLYGEIRFSRVRLPLRLERPGSGNDIYFCYQLHVVSFLFLFPPYLLEYVREHNRQIMFRVFRFIYMWLK